MTLNFSNPAFEHLFQMVDSNNDGVIDTYELDEAKKILHSVHRENDTPNVVMRFRELLISAYY